MICLNCEEEFKDGDTMYILDGEYEFCSEGCFSEWCRDKLKVDEYDSFFI